MTHPLSRAAGLAAVVWLAGCGPSGPPGPPAPVAVRGTVTLDAKPLADGTVDFFSPDGRPPVNLPVADGKYDGQVPPGSYTVGVRAYRPMKNPPKAVPNGPGVPDNKEQYLPAEYNTKTKLKADVPAAGGELPPIAMTASGR